MSGTTQIIEASMNNHPETKLLAAMRDIPDFPKPGIIFKDITPILQNPELFGSAIALMSAPWKNRPLTALAAIEARGFILGGAMACELGCGFIPIRKKGKLPWRTASVSYALEYGTDSLESHADAVPPGGRILLVDDVLATGGTAQAVVDLIHRVGGEVAGLQFLLELGFLKGRDRLPGLTVNSLLKS